MFHMYSIVDNIDLSFILFLRDFCVLYFCVLLRFTFSIMQQQSGAYLRVSINKSAYNSLSSVKSL